MDIVDECRHAPTCNTVSHVAKGLFNELETLGDVTTLQIHHDKHTNYIAVRTGSADTVGHPT